MLKDITLGQYFPGNSVVHRLDPRAKLLLLIVYIVALFVAVSWISYAVMLICLCTVIAISKIPPKAILRGMKPLVMILIFTAVLNIFFSQGETVLVSFWKLTITLEGLLRAVQMMVRILMLVSGTFLLTIHVPVHELSMMMCIALRFIPTLIEETDKIMSAQRSRGADFENGSLMERVKALIPILVPLFISAFRRADELATAMECRCYHGGEGRTKMKLLRYGRNDYIAFLLGIVLLAVIFTLVHFGL